MIRLELKRMFYSMESRTLMIAYAIFYIYINTKIPVPFNNLTRNAYTQLFFISLNPTTEMNMFYFLVPLICGILSGDILSEDLRNSFYVFDEYKIGRKKFIKNKAIASFLYSGIFISSMYLIDLIIKTILYPLNLPGFISYNTFSTKTPLSDIWIYHPLLYVFLAIFITFICSGLCSLVCYTVSLYKTNKYIVKCSAFVINYLYWNLINIVGIKDANISSILIFRPGNETLNFVGLIIGLCIPLFICIFIIKYRSSKYEFI